MTIEQYLQRIGTFAGHEYGKLIREQFNSINGCSELAMLAAPSKDELDQLKKAVAIMTPEEKQHADKLTDDQVQRIADDARIDPAGFAIFINGYTLQCKQDS